MRIALHEISLTVVLLLVGGSALAQTPVPVSTSKEVTVPAPAAANSLTAEKAAPAQISPETPIATIQGICTDTSKTAARKAGASKTASAKVPSNTCKTVITRAQMDSIADLLIPDATPDQRHQFALNYIRMVAASNVALEKRLDHDPAVAKEMDARLQFTRTQVMASSLYRRVEKLAEDVQEKELNSYYSEHSAAFTQAEIERIVLMKSNATGSAVDQVMLKTKAEDLQARAAKGEDFAALQKEAAALNTGTNTSWMKAATVVRAGMPPAEGIVFDVKPGEVTQVVDAPGAFEILKLVSIKPVSLDSVRTQLKTALTNGHLQLLMKDATKGVTANFNLAYLNLTTAPELFLPPSLRAPNGAPMGPGVAQGPSGMKRPQPRSEHSGAFPVVPNQAMPPQQ
jgi:PPIC-type PPIASE domain